MSSAKPLLSIVIPCFNEEEVLPRTHERLLQVFGAREDVGLEVVYVDDGSSDGTPRLLEEMSAADPRVTVVSLSRNFGHQPAVTAGLVYAGGDCVAVMDADLQDPPEVLSDMLERWKDGAQVVYGVRKNRKEGRLLTFLFGFYYRLLAWLADITIPLDSGDFSLMDRRVTETLNRLPEQNRFVRGLRAWSGFRQEPFAYDRPARAAGTTKYSFLKRLRGAFDGLFDFSTKPLSIVFWVGLSISILSFIAICFYLLAFIFDWSFLQSKSGVREGFTTIVLAIFFLGGVQLGAIGLLGEYIGRMYRETKGRPGFVVERVLTKGKKQPEPKA